MSSHRPSFPSLYNPRLELDPSHRGITQPNGRYLDDAGDIYLFTLYWIFILYAPLFLITGSCAAVILAFDPLRRSRTLVTLNPQTRAVAPDKHRKRAILYGLLIFFMYALIGTLMTVLGSTVVGFLIAGVYAAGRFRVSTWVPFVWALLQSLVTITSMCSFIIDII